MVSLGTSAPRVPHEDWRLLLPILEQPYRQVEAAIEELDQAELQGPPWARLLRFALEWPTEYWPGLALGWLEDGCPAAEEVQDVLRRLKDAPEQSQPLRHRALRLWRRG